MGKDPKIGDRRTPPRHALGVNVIMPQSDLRPGVLVFAHEPLGRMCSPRPLPPVRPEFVDLPPLQILVRTCVLEARNIEFGSYKGKMRDRFQGALSEALSSRGVRRDLEHRITNGAEFAHSVCVNLARSIANYHKNSPPDRYGSMIYLQEDGECHLKPHLHAEVTAFASNYFERNKAFLMAHHVAREVAKSGNPAA